MFKNHKILVAYFSPTGHTKHIAQEIAHDTNGDLFEIKPEIEYTKADLDWQNPQSRSSLEMKDPTSRPMIKDMVADMFQYDVIFLGFPIWWYAAPKIINTFLEQHEYHLKNKTIIPFATSGSSGPGETLNYLKPSAPNSNFLPCQVLNSDLDSDQIKSWCESLEI